MTSCTRTVGNVLTVGRVVGEGRGARASVYYMVVGSTAVQSSVFCGSGEGCCVAVTRTQYGLNEQCAFALKLYAIATASTRAYHEPHTNNLNFPQRTLQICAFPWCVYISF